MAELANRSIRACVVGLGKMGLLHASLLSVLPNVELVALCDKSDMILKISKKLFRDVYLTRQLQELAALDLDAVYVTTPIPSHYPIVKEIYSRNIASNLFVEKTLASDYAKAKGLCDLAGHSSGVNMVGYMKRFAVTFKKAKDLIDKQVLGQVTSFGAYAYSSDFAEVRKGSSATGSRGGVLGDLGSHVVDIAAWFFGDLRVEEAHLSSAVGEGSEDFARFRVTTYAGAVGNFDISWCRPEYRMPEFGLSVEGTKGSIAVDDDEVRLDLAGENPKKWFRHDLRDNVGFLLGAPEYFREDEHFTNSILENGVGVPDFLTASKVDYLIDEIKEKSKRA